MSENRILIAGKGRAAADAARALARRSYAVEHAAAPDLALARLPDGFDLALLGKVCGPGRSRLCSAIRQRSPGLPILLLGATLEELEMIGHPHGPDDFILRKFDGLEVCARVRIALGRRARDGRGGAGVPVACGPLRLDAGRRRAGFEGRWVELTAVEYQLLGYLARSAGRAVARRELLRAVWGYEHAGYSHTLTTHVNRLRRKLERELGAPRLIRTVHGLGYRIEPAS